MKKNTVAHSKSWETIREDWKRIHLLLKTLSTDSECQQLSLCLARKSLSFLQNKENYPKDCSSKAANIPLYLDVASKILSDVVNVQNQLLSAKRKKKWIKTLSFLFFCFSLLAAAASGFVAPFFLKIGAITSFVLSFIFLLCHRFSSFNLLKEKECKTFLMQTASHYLCYTKNILACLQNRTFFTRFEIS